MKVVLIIFFSLILSITHSYAQSSGNLPSESNRIPAHLLIQAESPAELHAVESDPFSHYLTSSYPVNTPSLLAPPANDACSNAIAITVNAPCVNGTTKEATVQAGETFACQGTPTQTVWYKFVATAANMYVEIEWVASSGCYFSSAVYSGGCLPSTSLSCEDAAGGPLLNIHNLTGLTVGATYLIQVAYTGGGPCGATTGGQAANTGADFCIKVGVTVNCGTCSNPCGSMCIFPTAPTVAQVTSSCTQYQLQSRLNAGQSRTQCYTFTALATSFSLQMIINTVGCSGGNVTSFNWTLYPSNCSAAVQSGTLTNLNATGLSIGSSYVLCYTWTAACQHNSVYPYMVATAPLPVELIYFDAQAGTDDILIKWITASEINNDYFSLQKSKNGTDFEQIAKISGTGNSNSNTEYIFRDPAPSYGINYYQLVQYDYDQTASASSVIAVKYSPGFKMDLISTTVTSWLQLDIFSDDPGLLTAGIYSIEGRKVQSETKSFGKGVNSFEMDVSALAPGMYVLYLSGSNQAIRTRFIKQ